LNSLNYAQGRYAKSNNSLNLNYNTPKIGVFANMSVGLRNSFQDLNINRAYQNVDLSPQSYFGQNSYIHQTGNSQNLRIGLDYYATEKTTFGIATNDTPY
jgi:ferric enterobactin receptor